LRQFKASMEDDIKSDVSGDYGKLLLLLLKDPSQRNYESSNGKGQSNNEPHVIQQVEEPKVEETPTLVSASNFNPNSDCEQLRKAMKGKKKKTTKYFKEYSLTEK
jgi:hypothetical protein